MLLSKTRTQSACNALKAASSVAFGPNRTECLPTGNSTKLTDHGLVVVLFRIGSSGGIGDAVGICPARCDLCGGTAGAK